MLIEDIVKKKIKGKSKSIFNKKLLKFENGITDHTKRLQKNIKIGEIKNKKKLDFFGKKISLFKSFKASAKG
jgi:hypothetical protein